VTETQTETQTETPPEGPADPSPPATGETAIDQALDRLTGLTELPVAEHTERLAQAHAVLDGVLGRDGADRT
jgi:hypothetical protein